MKNKIFSSNNIFNKLDLNPTKNYSKTNDKPKGNSSFIPNIRKMKLIINNQNNIKTDHSYIPKANILKILVRNQKNNNITDDTHKIVIPLRNRICDYQTKNDIIMKEIKERRNETKTFLRRYKMSGLLTPKNNSHFLKLGISKDTIKDIISDGYKMTDILNKTNIFDKSLLLNKQYANYARSILEGKNPELINDSKYLLKMNESLNEKKNSDLFSHTNTGLNSKRKTRKRISVYNQDLDNENFAKETKVSVVQLINEFNIINNDLKMIKIHKILTERKKRSLKKKELINKSLKNKKNLLLSLENKKNDNHDKKKLPLIKNQGSEKHKINARNRSSSVKNLKDGTTSSQNNKTSENDYDNIKISIPRLNIPKRKTTLNKVLKLSSSSSNSFLKSFTLAPNLNISDKDGDLYKNKRKNFNKVKDKFNSSGNLSRFNNCKSLVNYSQEDISPNKIMKKEEKKMSSNPEKRKAQIEEYKMRKNQFLQNLYNNMKIKRFNEIKNDISEYLKIYKGASIKEPDYEEGSHIYNLINDFILKNREYNLPNEIVKIRNKTNMFGYLKRRKYEEIKNLNNKVQNLVYDYAEDILELNNDIKK